MFKRLRDFKIIQRDFEIIWKDSDFGIVRILKDYEVIRNDNFWDYDDFDRLQNISNDDCLGSVRNSWITREFGDCKVFLHKVRSRSIFVKVFKLLKFF